MWSENLNSQRWDFRCSIKRVSIGIHLFKIIQHSFFWISGNYIECKRLRRSSQDTKAPRSELDYSWANLCPKECYVYPSKWDGQPWRSFFLENICRADRRILSMKEMANTFWKSRYVPSWCVYPMKGDYWTSNPYQKIVINQKKLIWCPNYNTPKDWTVWHEIRTISL